MKRAGWDVTAVMTRAARRFVGPESFRALTGNPVAVDLFPKVRPQTNRDSARIPHVDLASSADLVIVAPATANIIGKLANGIADDLLSTVLLAIPAEVVRSGRVLLAPAMNTNMWHQPAVQANISRLVEYGYRLIQPGTGELACGTTGPGRMAEPAAIFAAGEAALLRRASGAECRPLAGVRFVVTAGRTEEPIDPARIITNRSSGRTGLAIAQAAAAAGARVRLVAGALSVPVPEHIPTTSAPAARKMKETVLKLLPQTDVLVMCAAVADYQPVRLSPTKYHDNRLTLELTRTPDILEAVAARPHPGLVVGFSLDDSEARARAKLAAKKLDLIVANPFRTAGAEEITARLFSADGRSRRLPAMSKEEFARQLVATIAKLWQARAASSRKGRVTS